jgi:electron transfer flavoprotein alpha subunit
VSKKIWVHAELSDGKITNVTFELLSKALDLAKEMGDGAEVEATLIGTGLDGEAGRLAEFGAKKIYAADDPRLKLYSPVTYAPILADLASTHSPEIYVFGATAAGSALGPTVAARLKTGIAAHCVDLQLNGEKKLKALVPSFGGKVIGEILCPGKIPQMASVKPGIFVKKEPALAPKAVEKVDLRTYAKLLDAKALEPVSAVRRPPSGLPLNEAQVVICGGFGVGSQENWNRLEELARLLGGAAAATRPAVDEGWTGEHTMVGTSGQSIRPKVYIGFGISGATHHICGMNESGVIVSVNRDEEAAIFQVSDFRVVGDGSVILSALLNAVKAEME